MNVWPSKKRTAAAILLIALVVLVVSNLLTLGGVGLEVSAMVAEVYIAPRNDLVLANPYQDVDWYRHAQYKANLHTHTRQSDGLHSVAQVIDAYHRAGYHILALTDHDAVTWPWEEYGRNPEDLGMLAVQGNEISHAHHIGSYFCDYNIVSRRYLPVIGGIGRSANVSEEEILTGIAENNGLAVFFHPGYHGYPPQFYASLYSQLPHLIGMEVANGKLRLQDHEIWDLVLTMLMPERPVWGFANDDLHIMWHLGRAFNVFPLPELSEAELRSAMERGSFYFSYGSAAPVIKSILVDNDGGVVAINGDGWEAVAWISDGSVIHRGAALDFHNTANIGAYIRAELTGEGGVTYTQPFGVSILQ